MICITQGGRKIFLYTSFGSKAGGPVGILTVLIMLADVLRRTAETVIMVANNLLTTKKSTRRCLHGKESWWGC